MAHATSTRPRRRLPETAPRTRKFLIPMAAVLAIVGTALLMYFVVLPALFGPRGGGGNDGGGSVPGYVSAIATAKGDSIPIYQKPGGSGGEPWKRLSNPTPVGADRVFLVEGSTPGGEWLRVLLPIRPNGSEGWVRADDVTLSKTTYRVHVYLNDLRVVVKHGKNDTVVKGPIGIGTGNTPTPDGEYYITSLLKTPKENSLYGPYAFGLSAFSGVLETFAGGPARIGLHGTNKPELLGQRISHGCIRMSNPDIRELAGKLPLGTPVYVHG